jgi:hypothetical protein
MEPDSFRVDGEGGVWGFAALKLVGFSPMGTRIVALAVFAAGEAFCFEMLKRRAVESRLGAGTD